MGVVKKSEGAGGRVRQLRWLCFKNERVRRIIEIHCDIESWAIERLYYRLRIGGDGGVVVRRDRRNEARACASYAGSFLKEGLEEVVVGRFDQ